MCAGTTLSKVFLFSPLLCYYYIVIFFSSAAAIFFFIHNVRFVASCRPFLTSFLVASFLSKSIQLARDFRVCVSVLCVPTTFQSERKRVCVCGLPQLRTQHANLPKRRQNNTNNKNKTTTQYRFIIIIYIYIIFHSASMELNLCEIYYSTNTISLKNLSPYILSVDRCCCC